MSMSKVLRQGKWNTLRNTQKSVIVIWFLNVLIVFLFLIFLYVRFLVVNAYSAPAYTMTFLTIIAIIILATKFQNRGRFMAGKKIRDPRQNEFASELVCFGYLTLYDATILGCMLLNIATKGSIGSFETMGVRFAESHFDLNNSLAGVTVGSCGVLGCIALLSMGRLSKYMTDIQMIVFGIITMSIGIISLAFLREDAINSSWHYILSILLIYSIGYPIGHTAIMGLFSKSKFHLDSYYISSQIDYISYQPIICSFHHSCWKKTPRISSWLVCFGRILLPNNFSDYVWLRDTICRYRNSVCCADYCVIDISIIHHS